MRIARTTFVSATASAILILAILIIAASADARTGAHREKPIIADSLALTQAPSRDTLETPADSYYNTGWIGAGGIFNGPVFTFDNSPSGGWGDPRYVGGSFTTIDGVPIPGIAHAGQTGWEALGAGITGGPVYAISSASDGSGALDGITLFAGGRFNTAGGGAARNIARWDGAAWHALGEGVDSTVLALALVGSKLYVGGNFTHAGGKPANYIAVWDTSTYQWSPIIDSTVNGVDGGVAALCVIAQNLVVGGGFARAGTIVASKIAGYGGGGRWFPFGDGVDGTNSYVAALATGRANDIAAAGDFSIAGGQPANNVASYVFGNGLWQWQTLGAGAENGVNGPAYAIAEGTSGDRYVVTGDFDKAGTTAARHIAYYSALLSPGWHTLGKGLDGPGFAVTSWCIGFPISPGVDMICHSMVGGEFTTAGDSSLASLAIWEESDGVHEQRATPVRGPLFLLNYPNPLRSDTRSTTVAFTLPAAASVTLRVCDVLGRTVATLLNDRLGAGPHTFSFDAQALSPGTYFCALQAGSSSVVRSVVIAP